MSARDAPLKYWMCTQNNPVEEDVPPNVWPDVEYAIWQHERGQNGTEHLQIYVVFVGKKRKAWIIENCTGLGRGHWEPRNGTHEQAKAYCSKEESRIPGDGHGPWTHGSDASVPTKKGERTDLKRVFELMSTGTSANDIMTDPDLFPVWARYYRAFEKFAMAMEPKRNWITFTQVYWGVSGCGKPRAPTTRRASRPMAQSASRTTSCASRRAMPSTGTATRARSTLSSTSSTAGSLARRCR